MPDTTTPNYNLVVIQVGASNDSWGDKLNANATAIDAALKALADGKLAVGTYTAADVLAKLLTVDGAGSGLDADKLDGLTSADFVPATSFTAANLLALIKTVDGTGSGLDADTLDGLTSADLALVGHTHAIYMLKAGDTVAGAITRSGRGVHPHFADAGMTSGQIFVSPAGGSDPTSQPGDIWLGY